jgi:hypothetical protein
MDGVMNGLKTVPGDGLGIFRGRVVAEIGPFVQESHHEVRPMLQLSTLRTKSTVYILDKQTRCT